MQLRYYQQNSVDSVYRYLRSRDGNPCVVCPTGSGKSIILAQICNDAVSLWNGRVLVVTHVKELVEQNSSKIVGYLGSDMVGVYSAGLKKRQVDRPVTTAGIQSIYKKACEFDPFDLVIIDEAHLLPPDGDGMYRQFLKDAKTINPLMRVIGLTATPYRMTTGLICGPDNILNEICYEVGVKELITKGYLCPLKSKSARHKADTSNLHIRGGEFVAAEVDELMDKQNLVDAACREIVQYTRDRNSVIIFGSSVAHANHIRKGLEKLGCKGVAVVTGKTSAAKRAEIISLFKNEQVKDDLFGNFKEPIKYLINVNVLTTGFDAPNVDCVVLLRPTNSPGLYYQMVGRGLRLHPDKTDCLVLDFGSNIMRHGPIDAIQSSGNKRRSSSKGNELPPAKECTNCSSVVHAAYSVCPDCGFEFPSREGTNHEATASTEDVISGEPEDTEYDVKGVSYSVHVKRHASPDDPVTMRVDYSVGWKTWQSEWVCFEHTGYAREKARQWWKARSNEPVPETVQETVNLAVVGALAETHQITVRSTPGRKFDTIVGYALGEKPDGSYVDEDFSNENECQLPEYVWPDDDIPF